MTFVKHIPDKRTAVTAAPETDAIGDPSETDVGIGAGARCMRISRTHGYIDFLTPRAATTVAPNTPQHQLHGNKYCRRAGTLLHRLRLTEYGAGACHSRRG